MQGQEGTPVRRDAASMRVSDADRHSVAEVLRQAAGEGRIDLAELDERLEATYAAKTYADLVPITNDLPAHLGAGHPLQQAAREQRPALPLAGYDRSFAVMSETKRLGPWRIGQQHAAVAVMGSITLDLREAEFEGQEAHIQACAVMGEVTIVVTPGTIVRLEGVPVMGEFKEESGARAEQTSPSSPVVRVSGLALMGSVKVKRRSPRNRELRP